MLLYEFTYNISALFPPRAAGLFCKLSGLLTSYGLYQVVLHEQLCLYCRGSTASFSARMVLTDMDFVTGMGEYSVGGV